MSTGNELRDLRQQLLQTQEPGERRDILTRMLAEIQVGWSDFFESLAIERSPQRMLLMLAELDEIFERRKIQITQKATGAHA